MGLTIKCWKSGNKTEGRSRRQNTENERNIANELINVPRGLIGIPSHNGRVSAGSRILGPMIDL